MINDRRLLTLTRKVLSINSENPPGLELKLSRFIEKYLRKPGLSVRRYSFQKDRPNIIATWPGSWPRKKAAQEAILLTPHIDTVPIGRDWSFDPLGGLIHKGRIYGRGASDDKGNLACAMEVMQSLSEDGIRLRRDIILAATVDEETGSRQGIIPLLEKRILRPRYGVILDSDEFDAIIAQKGLIHCCVLIQGKKAHGAYPHRGINAIEQAAEIISRIKKIRCAFEKHALLKPPTVNIGVIKGGDKVNMVADLCEFALDIRYLPGMDPDQLLTKVKGIIKTVTSTFKIAIDDIQRPYEIDPDHPLINTYISAARRMGVRSHLKLSLIHI